ncbi:methyltransferase domain-containing protein [Gammaproteobacteria bacterium]|jgi:ubiquinone/menaquinone biosynthesis C-methylase UbiE|nr:methyltransferase domain-containing protein [Gammaproteobacteria bacterium]
MTGKRRITVDDAYSLETPDDSVRLYADWADSYDTDFVSEQGYIYHQNVADLLVRKRADINGAVLDVGCGTGVVGVALQHGGFSVIDGIDISAQMLDKAKEKAGSDGIAVYRSLIQADLTKPLDIPNNQYAALISAGTFTHGHVGPEALDELWRVAAPGAVCVIGINAAHYESAGFGEKLAADAANGRITSPETVEVTIYSAAAGSSDHADDKASVVITQIV